jgi:hypothetical protein
LISWVYVVHRAPYVLIRIGMIIFAAVVLTL